MRLAAWKGPVVDIATAPLMVDLALKKGGLERPIPASYNAFVYVIEGAARFGEQQARTSRASSRLGPGDVLRASTDDAARFLLFAGKPIGEPIARRGPFVMNTDEELQQALTTTTGAVGWSRKVRRRAPIRRTRGSVALLLRHLRGRVKLTRLPLRRRREEWS